MRILLGLILWLTCALGKAQQKKDTSHFDAFSTEEALKFRKQILAVFLSDTREQQAKNEFVVEKVDSCPNLQVLSAFTKKRLRLRIDFAKLPYLEEIIIEGLYDEHTLRKPLKNDSLFACHLHILDTNLAIPQFVNYFPQQTAIIVILKNAEQRFDRLSVQLKKFLKTSNRTNISFGDAGYNFIDRKLNVAQEECLKIMQQYVDEKRKPMWFFGIEIKPA